MNARKGQHLWMAAALCASLLLAAPASAKKPKAADAGAGGDGLNVASMRINALDMLYQLDLSVHQLTELRAAGVGAADGETRTPAKPNEKLQNLFSKMQVAVLAGTDDSQIAGLRNQIVDFVSSGNVELDDSIHPTAAAHAAAAGLCDKLKASQIAAFIALHADEVGDPMELMNGTLAALRNSRAAEQGGGADEDADAAQSACHSVGYLVAGMDEAKAKAVADQVAGWLKTGTDISEGDFAARRPALEAEARKIIGQIGPMEVLTHWMQQQMAILLSNPEAGRAIDLMIASRKAADAAPGGGGQGNARGK